MQNLKLDSMPYSDFMNGVMNAQHEKTDCPDCGGLGLVPVNCCSGHECGCLGKPIDFVVCENLQCETPPPKFDQIREWNKTSEKLPDS